MKPLSQALTHASVSEADVRYATERAMERWSRIARVKFAPADNESEADLLIGGMSEESLFSIAWANIQVAPERSGPSFTIVRGAICISGRMAWQSGGGTSDMPGIESTMGHEIGHILGLGHPGRTGALMGYANYDNPDLMASDIEGAQRLYGARD